MIIRKTSLPLALGLALTLAACDRPSSQSPGFQNAVPGKAVITVSGVEISTPIFESFAAAQGLSPATAENRDARRKLAEQLADLELLAQDAVRQKLMQDPEMVSSLLAQYYTTLAGAAVQEYTRAHPLDEEAIQKAYEDWVATLPKTEYRARHILVKEEATARTILEKLDQGEDFAKLAAEYSLDPSKGDGGDLGWFTPEQMVAPFADAVTALKPGETANVPVQTDFGWHVVKLEETRDAPVPKLEEARDAVTNHANNKQIEAYLAELRKKATIKVDEKIINEGGQPSKPAAKTEAKTEAKT